MHYTGPCVDDSSDSNTQGGQALGLCSALLADFLHQADNIIQDDSSIGHGLGAMDYRSQHTAIQVTNNSAGVGTADIKADNPSGVWIEDQ